MSNSLRPHGLQHARPLCLSPTPGVHPNPCPLSRWSSNHLILCHPLLLPSIFPSIRVFSSESALRITWPKYWSFSFSTIPSNEYSGLTSFRIDRFDLLAVQGTLKSLLQPRWGTVWRFLKKLEIELPCDPAIPLLGIHTKETELKETCGPQCSSQHCL